MKTALFYINLERESEMKCLILLVLSSIAFTTGLPRKGRIWGGQNATAGQFPYVVAFNDPSQYCDGIIIAPRWILTAAQCLFYTSSTASVYIGSHVNQANGTEYRITDVIVHEGFDDWTYQDDVALVKLDADLVFGDTIQAIEFSEGVAADATCTVIGWGSSQDASYPGALQYVETTVISLDSCQNISAGQLQGAYLGPEQLCTLAPEGQGTCFGDSGGPLVCDGKLAGVYSYTAGFVCAVAMPDIYISISAYLNWILSAIQP